MKKVHALMFPLVVALSAAAGCAEEIPPYTANQNVVNTMGEEAAVDKLRTLLKEAASPQVQAHSIDVDREHYYYQAIDLPTPGVPYGYGRGFVTKKVRFADVEYTQVWESRGHWYVRLMGDKGLDKIKWDSQSDAKDFADLIMSFKAGLGGTKLRRRPAE